MISTLLFLKKNAEYAPRVLYYPGNLKRQKKSIEFSTSI
jgi:hypothetical protein